MVQIPLDSACRGSARWLLAALLALAILNRGYGLASAALTAQKEIRCKETAVPRLASRSVAVEPVVDGELDAVWGCAADVNIPLNSRASGSLHACDLSLRSVYTDQEVYFFAAWEGAAPSEDAGNTIHNRLTIHFDIAEPWPGARDVACLVACHTAYADDTGRLRYMTAETIPPGQTDPLSAAGGWLDGEWRAEWSRPLIHDNLFDVQFRDLDEAYTFFVKVFERANGHADPVSAMCELVFQP